MVFLWSVWLSEHEVLVSMIGAFIERLKPTHAACKRLQAACAEEFACKPVLFAGKLAPVLKATVLIFKLVPLG